MSDLPPTNLQAAMGRKPRRVLRTLLIVAALLAILILATGLRLHQLYNRAPESWLGYQAWKNSTPVDQRRALAGDLVQRVAELANVRDRNGAPIGSGEGLGLRSIHMSFAEINAWLDTDMPDFLLDAANRRWTRGLAVPPGFSEPMLAPDHDGPGVVLSARYQQGSFNAVVSSCCDLSVPREGELTIKVRQMKVNDLRISRGILSRVLAAARGMPAAVNAGKLLDGKTIPASTPVWGGTREARLSALDVTPDGMDVTVNIVTRADPAKSRLVGGDGRPGSTPAHQGPYH
jgi:hypothetical protein